MGSKRTSHDALAPCPCSGAIEQTSVPPTGPRAGLGIKLLLLYVQPGGLGMEIPQQDPGAPGQIPGGGLGGQRPQKLKTNVHVNCAYASIKDTNAGVFLRNLTFLLLVCWSMEEISTTTEDMGDA